MDDSMKKYLADIGLPPVKKFLTDYANQIKKQDVMPCPNCDKADSLPCGYYDPGQDTPISPAEPECNFWWDDIIGGDPCDCANCPLIQCRECKDTAVANLNGIKRFL